jgi:hypothetical protein
MNSLLFKIAILVAVLNPLKTDAQIHRPLEYYSLINKAEMSIVEKNMPVALSFYERAFIVNPKKYFSEDLYKAFHCAMDVREYKIAEKYLTILLHRGLKERFLKNYILKYYKGKDSLELVNMIANHSNDTIHDIPANRLIHRLINIDQSTRHYWSEKTNGAYMVDSTYKADHYCARTLFDFFVSYGKVPTQEDLGNTDWDHPLEYINYSIIILHNAMANTGNMPYTVFDTIMYKAIFTYDYKPTWFRSIFYTVANTHKDQSIKYKNQSITFPIVRAENIPLEDWKNKKDIPVNTNEYKKEVQRMNKERRKIGLSTLEEYWAKHRFMKNESKTNYAKYLFL